MKNRLMCCQPDRDAPKMKCGYPLPCPWHTAVIDVSRQPVTVTIPTTARNARKRKATKALFEIAERLRDN